MMFLRPSRHAIDKIRGLPSAKCGTTSRAAWLNLHTVGSPIILRDKTCKQNMQWSSHTEKCTMRVPYLEEILVALRNGKDATCRTTVRMGIPRGQARDSTISTVFVNQERIEPPSTRSSLDFRDAPAMDGMPNRAVSRTVSTQANPKSTGSCLGMRLSTACLVMVRSISGSGLVCGPAKSTESAPGSERGLERPVPPTCCETHTV